MLNLINTIILLFQPIEVKYRLFRPEKIHMSPLKFIAIVVYGLIGVVTASALTLGRLQVNSGVGDPLKAEIEVTLHSAQELEGLTARMASERQFENDS
jgi:pilus assembly protein FimV